MLATAQTCAVLGLDGYIVRVEVDISPEMSAQEITNVSYKVAGFGRGDGEESNDT